MRRKLLSLLLSVFIILGTLPIYVSADEISWYRPIYWKSQLEYTSTFNAGEAEEPVTMQALYIDDDYVGEETPTISLADLNNFLIINNSDVVCEGKPSADEYYKLDKVRIIGSGSLSFDDGSFVISNPDPVVGYEPADATALANYVLGSGINFNTHAISGTVHGNIMDMDLRVCGELNLKSYDNGCISILDISDKLTVEEGGVINADDGCAIYSESVISSVSGFSIYDEDYLSYVGTNYSGEFILISHNNTWYLDDYLNSEDNTFDVYYPCYSEDIFSPDCSVTLNGRSVVTGATFDFEVGDELKFSFVPPETNYELFPCVTIYDKNYSIICSSLHDGKPQIDIVDNSFTYTPTSSDYFWVSINWNETDAIQYSIDDYAVWITSNANGSVGLAEGYSWNAYAQISDGIMGVLSDGDKAVITIKPDVGYFISRVEINDQDFYYNRSQYCTRESFPGHDIYELYNPETGCYEYEVSEGTSIYVVFEETDECVLSDGRFGTYFSDTYGTECYVNGDFFGNIYGQSVPFTVGEELNFELVPPEKYENETPIVEIHLWDGSGNIITCDVEDFCFSYLPETGAPFTVFVYWSEFDLIEPSDSEYMVTVEVLNETAEISVSDNYNECFQLGDTYKYILDLNADFELEVKPFENYYIFGFDYSNFCGDEYYYRADDESISPLIDDAGNLHYSFTATDGSTQYCSVCATYDDRLFENEFRVISDDYWFSFVGVAWQDGELLDADSKYDFTVGETLYFDLYRPYGEEYDGLMPFIEVVPLDESFYTSSFIEGGPVLDADLEGFSYTPETNVPFTIYVHWSEFSAWGEYEYDNALLYVNGCNENCFSMFSVSGSDEVDRFVLENEMKVILADGSDVTIEFASEEGFIVSEVDVDGYVYTSDLEWADGYEDDDVLPITEIYDQGTNTYRINLRNLCATEKINVDIYCDSIKIQNDYKYLVSLWDYNDYGILSVNGDILIDGGCYDFSEGESLEFTVTAPEEISGAEPLVVVAEMLDDGSEVYHYSFGEYKDFSLVDNKFTYCPDSPNPFIIHIFWDQCGWNIPSEDQVALTITGNLDCCELIIPDGYISSVSNYNGFTTTYVYERSTLGDVDSIPVGIRVTDSDAYLSSLCASETYVAFPQIWEHDVDELLKDGIYWIDVGIYLSSGMFEDYDKFYDEAYINFGVEYGEVPEYGTYSVVYEKHATEEFSEDDLINFELSAGGTKLEELTNYQFSEGDTVTFKIEDCSDSRFADATPVIEIRVRDYRNTLYSSIPGSRNQITINPDGTFEFTPESDAPFVVIVYPTMFEYADTIDMTSRLTYTIVGNGSVVFDKAPTASCISDVRHLAVFEIPYYGFNDSYILSFVPNDGYELDYVRYGNIVYSSEPTGNAHNISELWNEEAKAYQFCYQPTVSSTYAMEVGFSAIVTPPVPTGVEGFVDRCYSVILGREPEEAGMQNWMNALNNGTNCGAQVAYGFIFSQEYINKNKSNTEFVTDLYLMFFGRNPDSAGLNNWLNQLNAGVMTREQVFASFAKSAEYKNICSDYGILQGCYVPGYSTAAQTQVNLFVYRLYNTCLGRNADIGGLENWSRNILAGNTSGYSAALGFFTSTEYTNLNKSDEEFIKDLYTVMMDRNADAAGLENWVKQLTVYSREEVIMMFCKSTEFRNICARYGINVGV